MFVFNFWHRFGYIYFEKLLTMTQEQLIPQVNQAGYMVIDGVTYTPVYRTKWSDCDTSSDPDIDDYDTLEEAIESCKEPGDYWNKHSDHYYVVQLYLQPMEGDDEDGYYEDGDIISYAEVINYDVEDLYYHHHGSREDDSNELLIEASFNLGSDIEQAFKNVEHVGGHSKYTRFDVYNDAGDEVASIKLRIADHTYNPANNVGEDHFISVEIANKNETLGKYSTNYSIQFNGDNTYDDVFEAVKLRVQEIIDNI